MCQDIVQSSFGRSASGNPYVTENITNFPVASAGNFKIYYSINTPMYIMVMYTNLSLVNQLHILRQHLNFN